MNIFRAYFGSFEESEDLYFISENENVQHFKKCLNHCIATVLRIVRDTDMMDPILKEYHIRYNDGKYPSNIGDVFYKKDYFLELMEIAGYSQISANKSNTVCFDLWAKVPQEDLKKQDFDFTDLSF